MTEHKWDLPKGLIVGIPDHFVCSKCGRKWYSDQLKPKGQCKK